VNTFQLTGHPDWMAANSTPVPVLVAQSGVLGGGTFGPNLVPVSSGGAYMIAVGATVAGEVGFADISVTHLDVNGNTVWIDFFGSVMVGSGTVLPINLPGPTILRGNIYGATLSISGQVGTSAYLNGVLKTAGFTASPVRYRVYMLPSGIGDPDPKMSNGSALLGALTGSTPAGLLLALPGLLLIAAGAAETQALVPYSGPAALGMQVGPGIASPADCIVQIQSYTVANGTSYASRYVLEPTALNQGEVFNLDLPAALNVLVANNSDPANNVTVNLTVVAQNTA
jgi:hypothetical protein